MFTATCCWSISSAHVLPFNVYTLLHYCATLYTGPTSSLVLPCLMNRVYSLLHCYTLSLPYYIAVPCLYTTMYYIAVPCIGVLPCSYLAPFATSLLPFTQIPPTQSLVIWSTDVLIPDHHHCHHAEGDGGGGGGGSSSRSSISLSSSSLTIPSSLWWLPLPVIGPIDKNSSTQSLVQASDASVKPLVLQHHHRHHQGWAIFKKISLMGGESPSSAWTH